MADGYVVIKSSPESDPDGSKLSEVLLAQLALDRAESARVVMVYMVALFSVPIGILALWRDAPSQPRAIGFAAWAASVVGVVVSAASEWRHRRRRRELMAEFDSSGAHRR